VFNAFGRVTVPVRAEVVANGVPFGEGPVWCPDATIVCASVSHGALYRVRPTDGTATAFARTRGGANAAAPCSDGSFLVTQNGGVELSRPDAPPVDFVAPSLQRAWPDGRVEQLTVEPLLAPNDLVVGPDGTVFFTDPGPYPPAGAEARVLALLEDATTRIVADGFRYTNGIALDADGTSLLVVVDDRTVVRLLELGQGGIEPMIDDVGETGGDGLCVDIDGRVYVAMRRENGVRVFDPDGRALDFLPVDDGLGAVTNCCFGGNDGRTLFATEAFGDRLVAWESMPSPGRAVYAWDG
jgi:gluconolactonase